MEESELLKILEQLLAEQNIEQANSLIDQHDIFAFTQLKLLFVCVDVKSRLHKYPEASAFLDHILLQAPNNEHAHTQYVAVALDSKQFLLAEEHIVAVEKLQGKSHVTWRLRYRLANSMQDEAAKVIALTELLACQPVFSDALFKELFKLHLRREAFSAAKELLNKYKINFSQVSCLLMLSEIEEHAGDFDEVIHTLQQASKVAPENIEVIARLIHVYTQLGREAEAVALLEKAIIDGIADASIYRQVRRLRVPTLILSKAVTWAQSVPDSASLAERRVAAETLRVAREDFDDELLQSLNVNQDTEHDFKLLRPIVYDDNSAVLKAVVPGADKVMLVFTGLGNRIGMSIRRLDSYLATLNLSVIYLRDNRRLLFNDGIAEVADSYEQTITNLRNVIEQTSAKKLVTFGFSGGGFAAIRYGLDLKANKVIGISAATNITADFAKRDGRAKIIIARMQKYAPEIQDLKIALKNSNYLPSIQLFYAAKLRHDKLQAENLFGIDGVTLHENSHSARHDILAELEEEGRLLPFLKEIVERV